MSDPAALKVYDADSIHIENNYFANNFFSQNTNLAPDPSFPNPDSNLFWFYFRFFGEIFAEMEIPNLQHYLNF